jgi:putative transcriptional regulator
MTSELDFKAGGMMLNEIRDRRVGQGLSQGQLAAAMSVSRQTINSIETGRYIPSLPLALALARFFDTKVEDLFHESDADA